MSQAMSRNAAQERAAQLGEAGRALLRAALADAAPREASKVVFARDDLRVFCGERRHDGGLDFPGGKSESAETPRTCCLREMAEELILVGPMARERITAALAIAPCVTFDMRLDVGVEYRVSLFCVYLDRDLDVLPSDDGAREQKRQGWRSVPQVLDNLCRTRQPKEAGEQYARALTAVLSARPITARAAPGAPAA